jgi:hypothetical protein
VIEDRDRICRHPACTVTTNLDIHHLVHWANGGPTDTSKVACLCPRHHRAHHHGDSTITGDANQPGGLTFHDRHGQIIATPAPTPPHGQPPPQPATPDTHPSGEHLQLRWLSFKPPPNPPTPTNDQHPN